MRRQRSQLLMGEQRPSNLICVTYLSLAPEIDSGRLGEHRGGRGWGGSGVYAVQVGLQGKESINRSTAV